MGQKEIGHSRVTCRPLKIEALKHDGAEGGIVSEGVAQVLDDMGNPLSHCGVELETSLPLFVSLTRILPSFAGQANTYLTPVKLGHSEGGGFNDRCV